MAYHAEPLGYPAHQQPSGGGYPPSGGYYQPQYAAPPQYPPTTQAGYSPAYPPQNPQYAPQYAAAPQHHTAYPPPQPQPAPPAPHRSSQITQPVYAPAPAAPSAPYGTSPVISGHAHVTRRRQPMAKKLNLDEFRQRTHVSEEDIIAARQEHNKGNPSVCEDFAEVKKEFGLGAAGLFEFIKYMSFICLIFLVLQTITWGSYVSRQDPEFSYIENTTQGPQSWYSPFFITRYTSAEKGLWMGMNVLCMIMSVGAAPLFYFVMDWYLKKNLGPEDLEQEEREPNDKMVRYTSTGLIDVSYYYRPAKSLYVRRIISGLVFAGGLVIVIFVSRWATHKQDENTGLAAAFGIALLVFFVNLIYAEIDRYLTEFEGWNTLTRWKRSYTFKLIAFKMANIVCVYASKQYDKIGETRCVYDVIGEQFLMILVVDTILSNSLKVVWTMVQTRLMHTYASTMNSMLGDEDNMAPFDLAAEYLETLYRYYIGLMATATMPLAPLLTFCCLVIDFWVGKFRLFKLCGRPKHTARSQKGFLGLLTGCVTLVAWLTPYAGNIFVLAGITKKLSDRCTFP